MRKEDSQLPSEYFSDMEEHSLHLPDLGEVRTFVFGVQGQSSAVAIALGDIKKVEALLVRLHSRCQYGEVFGSMDCDCRAQLTLAFERIKSEGTGLLVYLEQEGRGCGLLSKAKAYKLRGQKSLDTVEAYRELGLPLDCRQYTAGAQVLKYFGIKRVRLLTNNPAKVAGLVSEGIAVEQMYLRARPTEQNIDYLRVKQSKLGHDLGLDDE